MFVSLGDPLLKDHLEVSLHAVCPPREGFPAGGAAGHLRLLAAAPAQEVARPALHDPRPRPHLLHAHRALGLGHQVLPVTSPQLPPLRPPAACIAPHLLHHLPHLNLKIVDLVFQLCFNLQLIHRDGSLIFNNFIYFCFQDCFLTNGM